MRWPPRPQRRSPRFMLSLACASAGAALFAARGAAAAEPKFFPNDVPTVFYISKSDDHNRVDFGIHLDARCNPIGDEPVFQYWREFENAPPVRLHTLGALEYVPYGISEQHTSQRTPTGATHWIRLRQFKERPITIVVERQSDGRCLSHAWVNIGGKTSELAYIFVQLGKGGLFPSVAYVDVHGRDPDTGKEVQERLQR